ncbi:MAG: DUF2344 domain-containing protein [Syntrophomonadaceae bacterium]|nr:DUF2344 domain-containing protein [Syntrophomonadaceae bacterium]
MRWRVQYKKGPVIRFLSHLDMVRLWERTLRRSGVTIELSRGFNPHLKLSLGTVLPVGLWGKREYLDLELDGDWTIDRFRSHVSQVLPPGIEIGNLRDIPPKTPALMAAINASVYRIAIPKAWTEAAFGTVDGLKQASEIIIVRSKDKKKTDIRPGIIELNLIEDRLGSELEAVVVVGGPQAVRFPELVMALADFGLPEEAMTDYWREANYIRDGGTFRSPLED